jgi:hypothetical protein
MELYFLKLLASVPVLAFLGIGIGGFALLTALVLPPRPARVAAAVGAAAPWFGTFGIEEFVREDAADRALLLTYAAHHAVFAVWGNRVGERNRAARRAGQL